MRSSQEIEEKIREIRVRIYNEYGEVSVRAACEIDALEWALGEDTALHDMSTVETKEDGSYVMVPWDGKA